MFVDICYLHEHLLQAFEKTVGFFKIFFKVLDVIIGENMKLFEIGKWKVS